MLQLLPARERGHIDEGWLDSWHTFSFGRWHDPNRMGFRALRVLNDDRVAPDEGFGAHPHRDMEILSYVVAGALTHEDSKGNGTTIRAGDVQRMSAGTGIVHSEFNESEDEEVHFLQIWIVPEKRGIAPSYEQRSFPPDSLANTLRVIAAKAPPEGALTLHQDATLFAGRLAAGARAEVPIAPGRFAFVHVVRGDVRVNGTPAAGGDGLALSQEPLVSIEASSDAELLVLDLA